MNKVFKVIWNHATQTWTAVSEFSKAKGKTKSKTLTTISLAVGSVLVSGNSLAATAEITSLKSISPEGIAITNSSIDKVTAGSDDPMVKPKHVIVIGDQSTHAYDETIMIGYRFSAYQYFGNAGANGKAGDTLVGNRIRIGGGANGQDSFGSALGYGTQVAGPSVSIGVGARADTLNANGWNATTAGGVAIGDFALSGGNINGSIGIGAIATADQDNSIAIGALSGATQKFSDRDLAYESGESRNSHAKDYSINEHASAATDAQRNGRDPKGAQMISIGYKSAARSSNSIALGVNAITSKNIKQPLPGKEDQAGQYSTKQSDGAVAIGNNAAAIKGESIALGHNAIAGGYTAQDIKALESEKTRLENMLQEAKVRKDQAERDVNGYRTTAVNKFALASINATYERISLALQRIKADLNYAAANNQETTSTIAIGASAHANSTNAIALGYQAKASGVDSISVGHGNNVTGNYSGAFGNNNNVKADKVFVLGNTVTVETSAADNRTGAVVLGDSSTVPTEVKMVNSAKIGAENGKKLVYSGFAGNLGGSDIEGNPSKAAAEKQGRFVSIGAANNERQLKFVAAGEISKTSTDAINGSQLYAFSDVVNNLAISTATIIGGGATLNQNGTLANFSHPLKTDGLGDTASYTKPADATNVTTAITNLNDYVNAGWKIAEGDNVDAKARISPNEQVNFKAAGLATVSVAANGTGANVTYTVTKGEFKDDTTDGRISAKTDKGDKAATVNDVSNAINRAYWKATAAGNGVTGADTPDNIKAGETVTLKAGKNLTVDHTTAKTFTFATVDTPNFNGVELVDKNTAADKKLTLTPTDAGDLKLNKGTNEAAKITNVVSGLAKFDGNTPLGHTATELEMSLDPAYSGLTNLADKGVANETAATVGDLRGMGWVVSSNKTTGSLGTEYTAQVKNANEVKFVGTGAAVVSGKTDDNTRTITVDVAKGTLENATTYAQTGGVVNTNRGKVTVKNGDADKVATVKNVADAINSAATIIKADNDNTEITDGTKNDDGEVVKAGDTVTYTAGKNLRVKRDAHNLTFALANDITVNNANVDTKLTISKTNPVGITSDAKGLHLSTTEGTNTNAPVYLNGIKSTLQDTLVAGVTTNVEKTNITPEEKARAASLQDVLNSGWNIRGKKQATDATVANVDFVRTYDTVDFISGDENTTEVTVNAQPDNKRTEVSIKAKTGETDVVTAADTGKKAGQVKAKANANAGTTTDQGSNLATVNAVANAVNSAYWKATAAGNGVTGTDTPDQVTAGTEVTFEAGKNLAVTHTTNKFEFKTKDDVEFTSVQIGTDGPKLTKDGDALKVSAADGTAPVKITNVKAGDSDNDAVNYKQLQEVKAATDNTIKLSASSNVKGTPVKKESETSDQKLSKTGGVNFKLVSADDGLLSVKAKGDTVTFTPNEGKVEVIDGKAVEATSQTGLVEATALTEALNKLGWKTNVTQTNVTTGATETVTKVVTPGTQVNYVDGNGTTANVIKNTVGGKEVVSVSYDVKAGANTIAFNKNGDELVKVGDKYYKVADVVDGKPTDKAVAVDTADIATADDSTPYENALNGLVNLTSSVQSNAMTVADAARMGWIVSTSANDYSANVTNTKEVNFVGLGAVDVSGSNVGEIRNINVSVDLPVDYTETTITENGQEVDVVKLSDGKWYKVSDLNDQGEPKDDAVAVDTKVTPISKKGAVLSDASSSLNNNPYKAKEYTYDDVNQTVTPKTYAELLAADPNFNKDEIKEGTNGVKLNNVGWAEAPDQAVNLDQLNQTVYKSGFYVKQNGVDTKGTNSAEDSATEKVTPEDVVNFVNGKNTVLKATTTRNAQTGQDTTNVTVDVDLPVVYTDAEGAKVVKVGDKYYYAEDVENGKLKNGVDADNDAVTNVVASMNNVASDDDTAGNNVVLRNVAEGTKTLAFDTEGNPLVEIDGKYYKLNEDGKADTTTVITPATSEQLKQLDDKYLANFTSAVTGLADLDHSDQSNALTVADAQKLGWVVSAGDYAANVTNANEVRFNGSNGISVTGETDKNTGVRNINVSIAKGKVDGNTTTGVATGDTNYVTGDQVAKAINESGWKTNVTNATTGLPETKVVTPGTQVDYVNGNGTTANVTLKDGKVAVSYNVNQTTGSVNPNGTATVTDGNAFLNASTVANLVNNSAFNVTTAKVDAFAENQEGKANAAVKAGGNITYTAGKNIAISQNGSNFTFSTTKDIEVDSVTANKRVQIGSGDTAVNLTTDLGALQVADKDGNATQITNVEAGTNVMAFNKEGDQLVQVGDKFYVVDPETNEVDFTKESTPATEEELDELAKAKPALKAYVAYSKAASGLADLDNSEQTNALTVADAQRLGWVVSASGNDYADSVTNANEVRFNGSNGISVTGETDEHGVRNINVSIAKGNVAGNTTTGVATGDTNYVTGDQVANAINNSGWKTTATKVVDEAGNEIVDANKATAVNPGDSVNYVDGNSTKANVVVTKAADGKETVNVSYDLVTEDHLTPVANDAKSVTKPTNIDAKGKDAATVNDVLNAGWNLQANDEAVDAVTHGNNVNFTSKDGSVKITAKSDGSTSSLDFAVNATSIVNQVAGTISYNKDGKATTNGDGKRIATVGDVANTINNTGWLTNVTDAKGNVTTKVVTPNTQVNYVNGDGTKANVVANSTTGGLDVTFNVKSANPETLTVDGNGVKVNTGSITEATDVAGDANRGKVTVAAGEGNKVATVQNVANAINSASWTVKVADTQEEITTSTANDEGSSVRAGNEITHVAGKNLKVKRDGRNVTYALANDVSVNTVTAQNSIKVGAGNAATTVTTSSAQDGVTEVKLADEAGKATRITNVAAGVKDTDAVNVSQLRNSNAQINQNIAHLNNKVNRMGKDLRAGIAGSNAAAGLPQVYIPGKSMVAAAAGTFKGQSAVAVGYSRASDNGKVILKLQGNANTRGDVGGSVGVGYQW